MTSDRRSDRRPRGHSALRDQAWIEARSRHRLSHAHVQMARELGLNPKKLGSIDNHDQELWRTPLPQSSIGSISSGSAASAPRSSCRSSSEGGKWRRRRPSAGRRGRHVASKPPPATARPDQLRRQKMVAGVDRVGERGEMLVQLASGDRLEQRALGGDGHTVPLRHGPLRAVRRRRRAHRPHHQPPLPSWSPRHDRRPRRATRDRLPAPPRRPLPHRRDPLPVTDPRKASQGKLRYRRADNVSGRDRLLVKVAHAPAGAVTLSSPLLSARFSNELGGRR